MYVYRHILIYQIPEDFDLVCNRHHSAITNVCL